MKLLFLSRMAYGNSCGLVIVDIVQRVCVLSMGTPDIYGNADPYQRAPRSPKRHPGSGALSDTFRETADDRSGSSPTTDQVYVFTHQFPELLHLYTC